MSEFLSGGVDVVQRTLSTRDSTLADIRATRLQIIFYARVSTAEQTLSHQITQAEQAGFKIDDVIADHGVSGIGTRLRERPEGRRLYESASEKGDSLHACGLIHGVSPRSDRGRHPCPDVRADAPIRAT